MALTIQPIVALTPQPITAASASDPNYPGGRTIRLSQIRGNQLAVIAAYPANDHQEGPVVSR